MNKAIPDGVYPTMITPFTEENKIDFKAVEELIEWYYNKGVRGIFAICQSSEIFYLSFDEKLELLKHIMKHVPSDMTVVASGHTSNDFDKALDEAKAYIDEGIDGYVFISNRFADENESDDKLIEKMLLAADLLPDIALGVYECPYPYKRIMNPNVLKQISENKKFRFLKDTCCDISLIEEKLDAVKGSNLKIFNANSATLLESLDSGCSGFSGVMANFHPELYLKMMEIYKTDRERASFLQSVIGTLSMSECQCYPVNAKYYLQLEGLDVTTVSRAKNNADLTYSRKKEIEQMRDMTTALEKLYF